MTLSLTFSLAWIALWSDGRVPYCGVIPRPVSPAEYGDNYRRGGRISCDSPR